MANNHEQFMEFNGAIRLTDARRKSLKGSRKELRRKIRKYFDDEKPNEIKPKFGSQGSFLMDTIVNPIPRKIKVQGEEITLLIYDIDDGVYFIGNQNQAERHPVGTYHDWIYEAVKDHTNQKPVRKKTCIRVLFADGHHIDLPIYYKQGTIPELAHFIKNWLESDPQAFTEWFNGQADVNPQLRRIVRYLKAWKDFREFTDSGKEFPTGLVLTILACNNYMKHNRDDISIKETLVLMRDRLCRNFECLRPTTPKGENLLAEYSHKDYFMTCLDRMIEKAQKAIDETNPKNGCKHWQDEFGDRFSCSTAKDEKEAENSPGLKTLVGTHKPYGDFSSR
jgi:hypothetical protein